jgi:mono/diheme cytochrome c family protein
MRKSLVVLACLAALVLAFTVEAAEKVEVVEVPLTWQKAALSDGEELYVELCAVCHGVDGTGDGPAAKALASPVPDLTAISAANEGVFPRAEIEKAIRGEAEIASHGSLEMPIWGRAFFDTRPDLKQGQRWALAEQRIFNLTEYLASIQE